MDIHAAYANDVLRRELSEFRQAIAATSGTVIDDRCSQRLS
jgi:hypothetical protein